MQCPVDGNTLVMTERSGVEIDYCPTCRGVWLDRGELDKIVSRATADATPPVALQEPPRAEIPHPRVHTDERRPRYIDDDDRRPSHRKKRRDSFLSDLFDF